MAAPVARASPDLWHLSGATVTTAHRRASARGHGVRRDQCVVRASGDASDSRGTLAGAGSTSLAGVASERRAAVQAQVRLITAAKRFAAELAEGEEDEEQLVAVAAFDSSKEALTEVQKRYAGKIAETLAQKVEELQVRNRAGSDAFVAGQKLYERGRYTDAVAALEQGVEDAGFDSQLGGEIALWLALAYDAAGQREDCISLYKRLEDKHQNKSIRKQAADLRFILEAPQLEIGADERVTLPVLSDTTPTYSDKWARASAPKPKRARSWEEEWLENYTPPITTPNRFVLAATSVLCFCLAVYSAWHIRH